MIPQVFALSGLPASGKTTLAKEWLAEDPENRERVNYDELRLELYGPDWRFNHKEEDLMRVEARKRASAAIKAGKSIVVDNTNLTQGSRTTWKQFAYKRGAEYLEQELDVPVSACVERDRLRTGKARVGRAVIERMALFHGWIDWNDYPALNWNTSNKDFVVVDVDGTLADCEHRKHYVRGEGKKDWGAFFSECSKDILIKPVADLYWLLQEAPYHMLVVSGRPIDQCGIVTEDWLRSHNIHPKHLFMRNGGDYRSDVEVKEEILEILPKERIAYVLDDRDSTVQMWRRNGLACLQVAAGDF